MTVDWEKLALGMCELFDAVEAARDDHERIRKLCKGRFELFEECGMRVEFFIRGSAGEA